MIESYAIIPVREFRNTKLRLSRILTESQRAAITESFLIHTSRVLDESDIKSTLVVSSDGIQSNSKFNFQKIKIIQESTYHGGVNSAVTDGVSQIRKMADNPKILVIPSDLPFLSGEAINKVLELLNVYDLVINPSFKKDGTNLLAFRLSNIIPLYYDQDSYSNHLKEANSRKLNFLSIQWKEFSFDVDSPEDLEILMRELNVSSFDSLLTSF